MNASIPAPSWLLVEHRDPTLGTWQVMTRHSVPLPMRRHGDVERYLLQAADVLALTAEIQGMDHGDIRALVLDASYAHYATVYADGTITVTSEGDEE